MQKIYKSGLSDVVMSVIMIALIFISGEIIGRAVEIPEINSDLINNMLPSDIDVAEAAQLKDAPHLFETGTLFTLATLDAAASRDFDPTEDVNLFMGIMSAIDEEELITMFRFGADNVLEIDYEGEDIKGFCNALAKTGEFSTVFYSPKDSETYTVYTTVV